MNNVIRMCFFLSIATTSALAARVAHPDDRFSINASLGYLSGTAQEFVYDGDTGQKISQLNWRMQGNLIFKAEGSYPLSSWLDATLRGWINLAQNNALMDDYDWLEPAQKHWTDWSHHPDTDLRQANEVDASFKGWFLQKTNYRLAAVLGYQRSLYSFLAQRGCYWYDNGSNVGCFPPDEGGIGYKQTFAMPYLGLAGAYRLHSFEMHGQLKYSNQVTARDVDQHYSRELTFWEGAQQFTFYNALLNVGYYIKPRIKLFAEGSFNWIPNKKTSSAERDNLTGEVAYSDEGSAGLNNKNYIIAVGLQYNGLI